MSAQQRHAAGTTGTTVPSAESVVVDRLYDSSLESALARLSPELRQVLQATVLDGLSIKETAVLLGIPEGTVKTRASRARATLRQGLA